jgi:WD40 repeat protein
LGDGLAAASVLSGTSLTLFAMPTFAVVKAVNIVDRSHIFSIQFNPTGNLVLMLDGDSKMFVCDVDSETVVLVISRLRSMCYSADGSSFFGSSLSGWVHCWNAETGSTVVCPFKSINSFNLGYYILWFTQELRY